MRYIIEDSRQQRNKHNIKHAHFDEAGIALHRSKLAVGDYSPPPPVAVDTKEHIFELAQCIDRDHERFKREIVLARDMGTRLIILTENGDGVKSIEDLAHWVEDAKHFAMRRRKSGNGNARIITGKRLAKACQTMSERYGVEFMFCSPIESASIIERLILGGDE